MNGFLRRNWPWALAVVGVAGVALAAVLLLPRRGGPAAPPPPDYWPTEGWRTSTPEEQGIDSAKLAEALLTMRERGLNIHSLMLIRHGYVIVEAYFYPYDGQSLHDVASVTKSVTTSLVGIAADQGYLSLDDPMLSFFPEYTIANLDARKQSITVRHLAGNTNGLESLGMEQNEGTLLQMRASPDWAQFALDRPMMDEPGARFVYDSPGLHLLSPILQQATGMTEVDFARQNLFGPLGIQEVLWPTDPQGYNTGAGDLMMHPRDAAKLGLLWLHQGHWDGAQLISPQWLQDATSVQISTGMTEEYGYGFWVQPESEVGPYYMASGRGGQRIEIHSALDIIAVTTAGGIDPGDALGLLAPAIIDLENPLPPNPAGVAQLEAAVAAVLQPPAAQPVQPLPEVAAAISGRTYVLEPNPSHLASLRLDFDDSDEAWLEIAFDNGQPSLTGAVGLDGVYRFAPGYYNLPAGRRGTWADEQTFVVDEDQIGNNHAYMIYARFKGDRVALELIERNGEAGAALEGRAATP